MLKAEKDFEEFIGLLNKHNVKYMVVGAYALALYTKPRNTGDIDIFIENSELNAGNVLNTMSEFGFESIGITKTDLLLEGRIIQLGVSPVRIDIMNSIDGVLFGDAYERIEKVTFGNTIANFISKADLIKNKMSSSRLKDKSDLDELQHNS